MIKKILSIIYHYFDPYIVVDSDEFLDALSKIKTDEAILSADGKNLSIMSTDWGCLYIIPCKGRMSGILNKNIEIDYTGEIKITPKHIIADKKYKIEFTRKKVKFNNKGCIEYYQRICGSSLDAISNYADNKLRFCGNGIWVNDKMFLEMDTINGLCLDSKEFKSGSGCIDVYVLKESCLIGPRNSYRSYPKIECENKEFNVKMKPVAYLDRELIKGMPDKIDITHVGNDLFVGDLKFRCARSYNFKLTMDKSFLLRLIFNDQIILAGDGWIGFGEVRIGA